ncbi:MAG TPA: TIGR00730 family Rossman fold protein [Acidimicrobiales bacterium]
MAEVPVSRAKIDELLDAAGAVRNRDLLADLFRTAVGLAGDDVSRLDLKIASASLAEMRLAFNTFLPYADRAKVTMFGSARTQPDDPLYHQTRRLAADFAERGWMVVTGAGPGIMAAGMEGAGRENSMGVTIRLPFEEAANEFIDGDEKLVAMKYFFTRKLMLVKESKGFVALPGGFGTQDETFELFTLQQTGKSVPAPVVLLDVPGGTYWHSWLRFVQDELVAGGLISPGDLELFTLQQTGKSVPAPVVLLDVPGGTYWTSWLDFVRDELVAGGLVSPGDLELFCITDDVDEACAEIVGFYRNFDSIRWARDRLIIRMRQGPDDAQLEALNAEHGELLTGGRIERSGPTPAERSSGDALDLDRIVMRYDKWRQSSIHRIIRDVNGWVPA